MQVRLRVENWSRKEVCKFKGKSGNIYPDYMYQERCMWCVKMGWRAIKMCERFCLGMMA